MVKVVEYTPNFYINAKYILFFFFFFALKENVND